MHTQNAVAALNHLLSVYLQIFKREKEREKGKKIGILDEVVQDTALSLRTG